VSVPGPARPALARRALAEFTGTGLLAAVVIGSGIMAVRLSPGAPGLELLENSLATAAGLAVIIAVLAPVSGAHLDPVVSAADWALGRRSGAGLPGRDAAVYVAAQLAGGIGGAVLASLMFALPAVTDSATVGSAPHLWLGEVVATAGLVLVVFALVRSGRSGGAGGGAGVRRGAGGRGGPDLRELKGRRLRWRTFPRCCSCAPTTRAGRRWRRRCWPVRRAARYG
jgi:glycerol uptake facilitator-like aquaporin